jgi:hypothetical protein
MNVPAESFAANGYYHVRPIRSHIVDYLHQLWSFRSEAYNVRCTVVPAGPFP